MTEGPFGVRSPQAHLEWEAASLGLQEQWANKTCSIGFLSNSQPNPGRSLWRGGFRPLPLTDSHWAKGIPPVLEIIKKETKLFSPHSIALIISVVDYYVTDKRLWRYFSGLTVHHIPVHHFQLWYFLLTNWSFCQFKIGTWSESSTVQHAHFYRLPNLRQLWNMSSLGVAHYTALWDSQNDQPANLLLQSSFSFQTSKRSWFN